MRDFKSDYHYANSRLSNTYIKKDGRVVLVHSVRSSGDCDYYSKRHQSEPLRDKFKNFDLSPIKLGNLFFNGRNYYTRLVPTRQYKQGLRAGFVENVPGDNFYLLTQTDKGVYNSIESCLELLENGEATSIPWHRMFSIRAGKGGLSLVYKRTPVGFVNPENQNMNLDSKHLYLQESLEEALKT